MTDQSQTLPRPGLSLQAPAVKKGGILAVLLILSLLFPFVMDVGPLRLLPHRILLLVTFVPVSILMLMGRAGRIVWADILLIFATIWACIALAVSSLGGVPVEAIGILTLEFLGAYLVARVSIRSAKAFYRVVWIGFISILIIVPFGVAESLLHRPILLDLIPKSVEPIYMTERWGLRRAQAAFSHPILFGVFSAGFFGIFWYALRPKFLRWPALAFVVAGT